MADDSSFAEVEKLINLVEHPEIKNTLVDLGMVRDIKLLEEENTVSLTLVLPMMNIPQEVLNYLANSLHMAVQSLGYELKVSLAQMSEPERQHFFTMSQKNWRM